MNRMNNFISCVLSYAQAVRIYSRILRAYVLARV